MRNTVLWCICAAQFPATVSVFVLVLNSQRKMTINNVSIEWGDNLWISADMLFFTPRADNNALITWNVHHGWKKKTHAVNKIYIECQFFEPQVNRASRSRASYHRNRGRWRLAPASFCDFSHPRGDFLLVWRFFLKKKSNCPPCECMHACNLGSVRR